MFAVVTARRSDAREFGDFLAVCLAKFRKLSHKNMGSRFRHAWNRAEVFFLLTSVLAVLDSFLNLVLGFCETLF